MLINKFNTTIKMIIGVTLVAVSIAANNCVSVHNTSGSLKKIKLVVSYPIVIMNNDVHDRTRFFNLKDTVRIYYYDYYVLYRLPGTRRLETDEKIPYTETWFIYREKTAYGFLFNSITDSSKGIKLPADSFLTKRAYASTSIEISPGDTLFEKIEEKNSLMEKYFPKAAYSESYPDSIYYYFSGNFENIDYSFSRKLDSTKRMKLYKFRLLYNEKFSSSYKVILPKREFLFEIKEDAIADQREIIDFINRVKKSYTP